MSQKIDIIRCVSEAREVFIEHYKTPPTEVRIVFNAKTNVCIQEIADQLSPYLGRGFTGVTMSAYHWENSLIADDVAIILSDIRATYALTMGFPTRVKLWY